jgi:hypothetical protein
MRINWRATWSMMLRTLKRRARNPASDSLPVNSLEARIEEMVKRGIIVPARGPRHGFQVIAKREGALRRFLEERD